MDDEQKLTKAQKREARKFEWQEKQQAELKKAKLQKLSIWIGSILVILATVGGLIWLVSQSESTTSSLTVPLETKYDFKKSGKDAKVTLIEYGDYECPACAAYTPLVRQMLAEKGDKINFVYRFFPLRNAHPKALLSAQAAFAANLQNKFWEMHDVLYDTQAEWSIAADAKSMFVAYAQGLGLDTIKFLKDMESNEAKKFVEASEKEAISKGINSTPSFFLNGVKFKNPNSVEEFNNLIDNELNKK